MGPELRGTNVLVRPYRPDDVESLYEAARESINEVYPWLPWCHPEYDLSESREWIEMRERAWLDEIEYSFAIIELSSGRYVGGAGLNGFNRLHHLANLGYWTRTGATGRGYATEAARLVAAYGIEHQGLNRVEILAGVGNIASQRVAERCGAQREGVLRRRLLLNDRMHDAVLYSLLPEDLDISVD